MIFCTSCSATVTLTVRSDTAYVVLSLPVSSQSLSLVVWDMLADAAKGHPSLLCKRGCPSYSVRALVGASCTVGNPGEDAKESELPQPFGVIAHYA